MGKKGAPSQKALVPKTKPEKESNKQVKEGFEARIKKIEDDTSMDSAVMVTRREAMELEMADAALSSKDRKAFKAKLQDAIDNRTMEETCEKWCQKIIIVCMMLGPCLTVLAGFYEFATRPTMVLHPVAMQEQFAIVTGGCDGMGRHTATLLVQSGASVILGCSANRTKMDSAVRQIRLDTGMSDQYIAAWPLDLHDFKSVHTFAERYTKDVGELQLLINNAGTKIACQTTKDDMEWAWQVNYVAPYLLTERLVPLLIKSAPSRVVHVTCDAGVAVSSGGPWPLPSVVGAELNPEKLHLGEIEDFNRIVPDPVDVDEGAAPLPPLPDEGEDEDEDEDDGLSGDNELEELPLEGEEDGHVPFRVAGCSVAKQYEAAKLAQLAYSNSLDRYFRRMKIEGVTSHAINPGPMLTQFEAKGTPLPATRVSARAKIMQWFPPFYIMGWIFRNLGSLLSGCMTRSADTGAIGVYHVATAEALQERGGGLYSDQSGTAFVGCDKSPAECGKVRALPPQVKDKAFRQKLRALSRAAVDQWLPSKGPKKKHGKAAKPAAVEASQAKEADAEVISPPSASTSDAKDEM